MAEIKLGITAPAGASRGTIDERRSALAAVADAGLDFVSGGDHVSFFTGTGFDGLVQAAQLLTLHDTLEVYVAVYLLPLRHPTLVARQIQSVTAPAPGRLTLGVGVGGEDPHESEVCGVDPHTRGRRANESLEIVRALMTGEPVDYRGEFFQLEQAVIRPAVEPPVPIVIGGRSDAAVRRAGRLGDGYIGVWISARRFASIREQIDAEATACGRNDVDWQHGMFVWCGLDDSPETARKQASERMESLYHLPFERFERYTPCGPAADVAEFLRPYVEAGCTRFDLSAVAGSDASLVAHAAEIKRLLNG
ncbi:MAG: LLM class flavin-dependent oxidoreductase [Myxococcota bacterium]